MIGFFVRVGQGLKLGLGLVLGLGLGLPLTLAFITGAIVAGANVIHVYSQLSTSDATPGKMY